MIIQAIQTHLPDPVSVPKHKREALMMFGAISRNARAIRINTMPDLKLCSGEAVLSTVILAETGLAAGSCVLLFRWDASFLLPNTFGLKTGYAILG